MMENPLISVKKKGPQRRQLSPVDIKCPQNISLYKRVDAESLVRGIPQNIRDKIWTFYSSIRPNDEIWYYNSQDSSGYAIVRHEFTGPEVVSTYEVWRRH